MSILRRIPFFKPAVRPVGDKLELGDTTASSRKLKRNILKTLIISTVIIAAMAVYPRGQVYEYTVTIEDIWQQENLQAPFQFAIRKPEDSLKAERDSVRQFTEPIFSRDNTVAQKVALKADSIQAGFNRVFEQYGAYQFNLLRGQFEAALADSVIYLSMRDSLNYQFSESVWQKLLRAYANSVTGLVVTSRSQQRGPRLDEAYLAEAEVLANTYYEMGVMDVSKAQITADRIDIRVDDDNSHFYRDLEDVFGLDNAIRAGVGILTASWQNSDQVRLAVTTVLFQRLIIPNLKFGEEATSTLIASRLNEILPTEGLVRENEVIVRRGDIVTAEIHQELVSLEAELNERAGTQVRWKTTLGQLILTLSTFLIFFLYLYLLRRPIFDDNKMVFLIVLLFLGVIGVYGVALRAALLDMYVVPVAIVAILLTVIFDSRVALFGALTMAMLGGHLLNYDFAFLFSTVFASTLGIFSVRDIRNRGQFFISASVVFGAYMTILCANFLLQNKPIDRFFDETVFLAINAILMLLAYPALWIFERAFGITTDLTLLELSDTNHPILKELSMKAPGTFNHVLQVANIAEAAAAAIGANALLTRVGALYHDIGKMVKPEYFIENQRGGVNPHDGLKPRMSALIIASHVKEGLDLAKKIRLPEQIQDFIPMHHGTTRIEYFYRRALDQHKEGDAEVQESEYRYPGPIPTSKETSILMLADSVEAASRAMDNPTHKRLQGLIDGIVNARREDGQLDNTDLTFTELNIIKETFLNILLGIFHVRVKYPGEEESEKDDKASGSGAANTLNG